MPRPLSFSLCVCVFVQGMESLRCHHSAGPPEAEHPIDVASDPYPPGADGEAKALLILSMVLPREGGRLPDRPTVRISENQIFPVVIQCLKWFNSQEILSWYAVESMSH
jgi:hypothetical protein